MMDHDCHQTKEKNTTNSTGIGNLLDCMIGFSYIDSIFTEIELSVYSEQLY